MKKFNNSDLFTGYLKQLLHNFHLPKIKIYTKQHEQYLQKYHTESPEILETLEASPKNETNVQTGELITQSKNVRYFPYLKDGEIQEYVDDSWRNIKWQSTDEIENNKPKLISKTAVCKYTYGDKLLNYTKNLKINSNIYDSYTHEYLGDYLRFHRDYLNLNLMPLYNCFSDRACKKLQLQWAIKTTEGNNTIVNFDSSDSNFKIYMLPVKLFQRYTIAIDSSTPIEMCCGLYGDYQDNRTKFINLPKYTYKRVTKSIFSQPFIYDALVYTKDNNAQNFFIDTNTLIELAQNECDLKLFLKIPNNNDSTIVVLEGDYCNWNDYIWDMSAENAKRYNKTVINLDANLKAGENINLITPLQLLQFNTREQHPFADRLIEYLIGNAITNSEDEIYDNVRRAQKALTSNRNANNYRMGIPGIWSTEMSLLFYEYMTSKSNPLTSNFEVNHDILGYVDKDVEKFYPAISATAGATKKTIVSLANIELEEGDK